MTTGKKVVIALGGNAIQAGDGTAEAQQQAIRKTVTLIVEIIKLGYQVIITHGNGPQVGNILLQQTIAGAKGIPPMALDTCGAMSQGMIGYWMEKEIDDLLREQGIEKGVVSIVTRTEVDPNDPAFANPTKPIGPFYTEKEAMEKMQQTGCTYVEDAGRGWRRVVPSPMPIDILEHGIIGKLADSDQIVICAGGGGIPVYKENHKYIGVEAVIDKDFSSEKLAELIDADTLLILTGVEHVYIHYNEQNEETLKNVSIEDLKEYIAQGHFAQGSMLPKVEAGIVFAQSKAGRTAIITSLDKAIDALLEKSGTIIKNTAPTEK